MTPALSIVLPCYNESGNLPALLARYRAVAAQIALELILVDNGSTDDTPRILGQELGTSSNAYARSVRVPRNIGYGHGLAEGLKQARAPVVGFSHADLQTRPEDVLEALRLYEREAPGGACLVKGWRRGQRAFADRVVTWCYNHIAGAVLGLRATRGKTQGAPDLNGEPKLFDRALMTTLGDAPHDFTFDLFVLVAAQRQGYRLIEFETSYEKRSWGTSKLAKDPWMRLITAGKALRRLWALRQNRAERPV